MGTFKYTIIKDKKQYSNYCEILENLVSFKSNSANDEVEFLELLIAKWVDDHNSFNDLSPIELLKTLMNEHNLKAQDLVNILDLTKGTISKILNLKVFCRVCCFPFIGYFYPLGYYCVKKNLFFGIQPLYINTYYLLRFFFC